LGGCLGIAFFVEQVAEVIVGDGFAMDRAKMAERLLEPPFFHQHGGNVVAIQRLAGLE
jgi:hypothetical protein